MALARHRWIIEGNKLKLADGTEWKLPRKIPDAVRHELARLPHDYIELGHRCADLQEDVRMAKRAKQASDGEVAGWKMKYENIINLDVNTQDKIIGILTEDMEKACNLLIRISVALGIQPGGEFYNMIKSLVEKYGMKMHYAKDYNAEGTPAVALDSGRAAIRITEQGKVELKPQLPPGEYIFPGDEDDPFDYHLHIWEDEGGVSEKGQLEEDMLQDLEERKRQND